MILIAIVLTMFFASVTVNLIFWDVNKELGAELDDIKKKREIKKQEIYHAGFANGVKSTLPANAKIEKYKCPNGNVGLTIRVELTPQEMERA